MELFWNLKIPGKMGLKLYLTGLQDIQKAEHNGFCNGKQVQYIH